MPEIRIETAGKHWEELAKKFGHSLTGQINGRRNKTPKPSNLPLAFPLFKVQRLSVPARRQFLHTPCTAHFLTQTKTVAELFGKTRNIRWINTRVSKYFGQPLQIRNPIVPLRCERLDHLKCVRYQIGGAHFVELIIINGVGRKRPLDLRRCRSCVGC